jgi:hypothetical protein
MRDRQPIGMLEYLEMSTGTTRYVEGSLVAGFRTIPGFTTGSKTFPVHVGIDLISGGQLLALDPIKDIVARYEALVKGAVHQDEINSPDTGDFNLIK